MRLPYQDILDKVDERTRSNKALYRKRQEIVEHPFGTIKAVWGYKQFLCRTKPKVAAEIALAYTAYNLRRAINIFAEKGMVLVQAVGRIPLMLACFLRKRADAVVEIFGREQWTVC